MPARDLPDLNVWLALADPDHQHHARAKRYWEAEAAPQLAFCRLSMLGLLGLLGLLRLLTHPKIMHGTPFTPAEAWLAYRSFLALPEVTFLSENPRLEPQFVAWTDTATFTPHRWTDAVPTRCSAALSLAIQEAKPKARKVSLPSATIENEVELDAWLAQARTSIQSALKDGPAIV